MRPIKEVNVTHCYPYWHMLSSMILGRFRAPVFPTCPLLYMVSSERVTILIRVPPCLLLPHTTTNINLYFKAMFLSSDVIFNALA